MLTVLVLSLIHLFALSVVHQEVPTFIRPSIHSLASKCVHECLLAS